MKQKQSRIPFILFLGLAIAWTPLLVVAAPDPDPPPDALPEAAPDWAEDALFTEIPTVISASRYEQGVNEAPASITIARGGPQAHARLLCLQRLEL
jgi:hypothetical protein